MIDDFIPNMAKLMREYLPFGLGDMYADIHLALVGFLLLTVAIFLDKLVAHIIFEQAVASISERIADETLNDAVAQGIASVRDDDEIDPLEEEARLMSMFGEEVRTAASTAPPPPDTFAGGMDDFELPLNYGRRDHAPSEDDIIEAASTILSTSAVAYFGPVERYISALMPSRMYAGFPRSSWSGIGRRLGLVEDADAVTRYNEFGSNRERQSGEGDNSDPFSP